MRPTPEQEAKLAELQAKTREVAREYARLAAELGFSEEEIAETLLRTGNNALDREPEHKESD